MLHVPWDSPLVLHLPTWRPAWQGSRSLPQNCKQASVGLERTYHTWLPATTKLGQGNVFTGICDSVNRGCLSTPGADPPKCRHPEGADTPPLPPPTPGSRHPQSRHPPRSRHTHPREQTPPRETDSSIQSTSGRYASYWNAFLLILPWSCGIIEDLKKVSWRKEEIIGSNVH